jgi:hypothetical protein
MKTSLKLLLPVVAASILAACGGGGGDNFDDRVGLASPKVRLLHAIPTAGTVSLNRDGTAFGATTTDLAYKSASPYAETSTSSNLWSVSTTSSPAVAVGSVTFNADTGHKYTFIAIADTNPATSLQMIDDPYNKGLTSSNARVRVFNGALNAQNGSNGIDVYLTPTTLTDISAATPNFAGVGFKRAAPATGSDSLEVAGGNFNVFVTAAGTKTVIFRSTITLENNADWLIVPVPASATANDIKVLVAKTDAGTPSIELPNQP